MRNGPPHGPASMSRAVHEGLHHETGREEAAASPPSRAVSPPIPRRHVPRDVAAALRAADAPRPGASLDYRQTAGAVINPRLPPDRRWIRAIACLESIQQAHTVATLLQLRHDTRRHLPEQALLQRRLAGPGLLRPAQHPRHAVRMRLRAAAGQSRCAGARRWRHHTGPCRHV